MVSLSRRGGAHRGLPQHPAPPHSATGRLTNRFAGLRKGAGPKSCPPSAPFSTGPIKRPIPHTITLADQLSTCVDSTRSEALLDALADPFVVGGVGAQ